MNFHCESPFCADVLSADHVTLITTAEVRRFFTVELLIESYYHGIDVLMLSQIIENTAQKRHSNP
jgi:hypothetical protein